MLLRIFALGAVLIATQTVSAEDTPAASNPSNPEQAIAIPAQQPPHPVDKPAGTAGRDATPQVATSQVATSQAGPRGEQLLLLQQKCEELDRLQREIQQLRAATGTAQQILVKVQMLEVDLTKARRLGMDISRFANASVGGAEPRPVIDATAGPAKSPAAGSFAKADSNGIMLFAEALKQNQLAKLLAEPTVVVVSGRPASFNVGGEFPVLAKNDSKAAVEFRHFGTELNLLAVAIGDNRVRLDVRTRVSEIDDENPLVIDGTRIPGFKVRECDTASELAFGQSAVLTGLVQQRTECYIVEGQVKEALVDFAIVVIVTPELVHPLEPLEAPAAANRAPFDRARTK